MESSRIMLALCVMIVTWHVTACQTCKPCGRSCCTSDQTCEMSVNGGTCYKTSDRVTCNFRYYCYEPMSCCGFSKCCPAGSKCEAGIRCVVDGSSSSLYDNEGVKWYYFVIPIVVVVVVGVAVGVICMKRRVKGQEGKVISRARAVNMNTSSISNGRTVVYNTAPKQPTNYSNTPHGTPQYSNGAYLAGTGPINNQPQLSDGPNIKPSGYPSVSHSDSNNMHYSRSVPNKVKEKPHVHVISTKHNNFGAL